MAFIWIPWFIVMFWSLLEILYRWQVKEYRFDRMISWIREDAQFSYSVSIFLILKVFVSLLGIMLLRYVDLAALYFILPLTYIYYVYFALEFVRKFLTNAIHRPTISPRNLIIATFAGLVLAFPFAGIVLFGLQVIQEAPPSVSINNLDSVSIEIFLPSEAGGVTIFPLETVLLLVSVIVWTLIDALFPLIITLFVGITEPIAILRRHRLVGMAKDKIKKAKSIKIIGITGSYGKSTTKEILYALVKKKWRSVKTPANYNTHLGAAKTVSRYVRPDTEVLIVEMGAYRGGEIRKICEITPPDIAVVTGINEQHMTLFKDIQGTIRSKFEIIEYAKDNAIVVINADNEYSLKMSEMTQKETVLYSSHQEVTVWASNITSKTDTISLTIHYGKDEKEMSINMIGAHNVSNILAAVSVSLKLGMSLEEIAQRFLQVKNLGKLSIKKGPHKSQIIDDSYNSNPDGFSAALDVLMEQNAQTRILVSSGILELGDKKDEVYARLGKEMNERVNVLITSDADLASVVSKDVKVHYLPTVAKQYKVLESYLNEKTVVLLEGANLKLAEKLINQP